MSHRADRISLDIGGFNKLINLSSSPCGRNTSARTREQSMCKYFWLVLIISFICLITLLLPPVISAQEVVSSEELPTSRPDPEGVPTKVSVAVYVINIESVSGPDQSFTANIALSATWQDPRLACKPGQDPDLIRSFKLDQVWHPTLYIVNQRRVFKQGKDLITVDCEGKAEYSQMFYGDFLTLADIKDFPFDKRPLNIEVLSTDYTPEEVELNIDEEFTGRGDTFSIADWYIDETPTTKSTEYILRSQIEERLLPQVVFSYNADRNTGYYLWKVIAPMFLIVFMSWTVFWIPPDQIGPQIGLSVTSMLTLIAYRFALSNITPHVDYLTRFDKFSFASTLLIFFALIESVTTSSLSLKGRYELAERIDSYSRIIFPAAFVIVAIFSFLV